MYLFYVYVYVLYELFFIDNVVRMLFYVNICACHVYFTITLLTYLLRLTAPSLFNLHAWQSSQARGTLNRQMLWIVVDGGS